MPNERSILFWMCVLVGANQLGFGGVVPALPLYAQSFGVSASAIGMAVAIYGLARFCSAAPSGLIADRFGRRHALVLGALVTAAGNLWCALAAGYPEFILARFAAGLGAGLIITAGQIVLADISTPERRGRTMAIYQGTFIFAVGIGPYPGGWLAEHFGLAAPFAAYAVMGIVTACVAGFVVAETKDMARARHPQTGGPRPAFITQLGMLLRQRGFVLVGLIALFNAVTRTGGLFSIVPLMASLRLGLSVADIGLGLALGSILGLVVVYPSGMLVDYFGRKAVIAPSTMLAGVSILLFCVAGSHAGFIAACLAWGGASSIGGSAPAAYAADSAPPGMNATTMSLYRMSGDIGYVAGPILLGAVADLASPELALYLGAGLLIFAGISFFILAPETHRNRAA